MAEWILGSVAGPSSGGSVSPLVRIICVKTDFLVTQSIPLSFLACGRSGFGRSDILELFLDLVLAIGRSWGVM